MNGGREDQNKRSKFHVTVVESRIVTTGPCVTRVAYSNSGQPQPQLRRAESITATKPQGQGGDAGAKHRPHPTMAGGGGYHGVGGGGGGACGKFFQKRPLSDEQVFTQPPMTLPWSHGC